MAAVDRSQIALCRHHTDCPRRDAHNASAEPTTNKGRSGPFLSITASSVWVANREHCEPGEQSGHAVRSHPVILDHYQLPPSPVGSRRHEVTTAVQP